MQEDKRVPLTPTEKPGVYEIGPISPLTLLGRLQLELKILRSNPSIFFDSIMLKVRMARYKKRQQH